MLLNIFIFLLLTLYEHRVLLKQIKSAFMPALSKEFIDYLNNAKKTWKAGHNFPETANLQVIKNLMGSSVDDTAYKLIPNISYTLDPGEKIPISFDSRKKWPLCPSLHEIREQGACASCWAVVAAATMTDRYCIFSNQTQNFHFSSINILTCCLNWGCKRGGEIAVAWQYWSLFGVVSGGEYKSKEGCRSYKLPPCDFSQGCNKTKSMFVCEHKCHSNYSKTYKEDKKFAKRIFSVNGGEHQIQMEIMKNGPVQAVLQVNEDFLSYKSGVYRYIIGRSLGGHAVKILGWGEEHGNKYWIAANSWGTRWGDNGYFKIIRGEDHCGIESIIMAGEPKLDDEKHSNLRLNLFNRVKVHLNWNIDI